MSSWCRYFYSGKVCARNMRLICTSSFYFFLLFNFLLFYFFYQNGLHNQIRSKEKLTFLLPCFLWRAQLTGSSLTPRQDLGHIFSFVIHFVYLGNTGPESRKSPDNWSGALGGRASVREASYLPSHPYQRSEDSGPP